MSQRHSYALDSTVTLHLHGTRQRVRLCGNRPGLPPVLVVQAGPGLPLLNEAARFQQLLQLEPDFAVAYWDQRGCGHAALQDAQRVSLKTQVDDVCAVVRWLADETQQRVVVLGISLGATFALQAAARDSSRIKAMVAVSIDADTACSDAAVSSFLREVSTQTNNRRLARSIEKLGTPPYVTPAPFQLRERLLTDLGGIEQGRRFGELLRGLLYSLVRTYGWRGAVMGLRNMNAIQRQLLPEVATLNLFAHWPRPAIPVHYVFGGRDPLVPSSMVQGVSGIAANRDTVVTAPDAGHMVHFDEPALVRSLVVQAHCRR
jgi:pimeloyl-ACP methyl ester carboxylesterase